MRNIRKYQLEMLNEVSGQRFWYPQTKPMTMHHTVNHLDKEIKRNDELKAAGLPERIFRIVAA
jgi:hypothetical protein